MVKPPTRYRSYGRQMALALNRGQQHHFDRQMVWYKLDLRKESPEDQARAENIKEDAFWEFRSEAVYPCEQGIKDGFKSLPYAPTVEELRKHCARKCSDYSFANFCAALDKLRKEQDYEPAKES